MVSLQKKMYFLFWFCNLLRDVVQIKKMKNVVVCIISINKYFRI